MLRGNSLIITQLSEDILRSKVLMHIQSCHAAAALPAGSTLSGRVYIQAKEERQGQSRQAWHAAHELQVNALLH